MTETTSVAEINLSRSDKEKSLWNRTVKIAKGEHRLERRLRTKIDIFQEFAWEGYLNGMTNFNPSMIHDYPKGNIGETVEIDLRDLK